jgi:hypothetical protein
MRFFFKLGLFYGVTIIAVAAFIVYARDEGPDDCMCARCIWKRLP